MLDGIDYYPSKTKKKPKLKIGSLVVLLLVIGVYFAFQNSLTTPEANNNQTLIVISKAEKPIEATTSIIIKSNKSYQPEIDRRVKSNKGLDELIQTFEQQ